MTRERYHYAPNNNHPIYRVSLLKLLSDNSSPRSLATAMRRRRFAFFKSLLDQVARPVTILDVGGTSQFWELMGIDTLAGVTVTLLNQQQTVSTSSNLLCVTGDARDLGDWESQSVDVVFSNSVIEHLGPDFADQKRMADEIRRVGRRYFVQTPNRYFFLEPHFLTPGFQFFPVTFRAWLVRNFNVGWYRRIPDPAKARHEVESIALLSIHQVRALFPEAEIFRERVLGFTKSFVAYSGWEK